MRIPLLSLIGRYYLWIVWSIAFVATVGSLFISEFMDLPPCDLCWYQRAAMYPIFIIATVALAFKESHVPRYVLALAVPGALLGLIQYLMQKTTLIVDVGVCSAANPCSDIQWELFGFITIPLMSLVAFAVIIAVTVLYQRWQRGETSY